MVGGVHNNLTQQENFLKNKKNCGSYKLSYNFFGGYEDDPMHGQYSNLSIYAGIMNS